MDNNDLLREVEERALRARFFVSMDGEGEARFYETLRDYMRESMCPNDNDGWIPVAWREPTEEEKERHPEITAFTDSPLPDDGEDVLITVAWRNSKTQEMEYRVYADCAHREDGIEFENVFNFEELIAWRPMPEPYKGGDTSV